MEDNKTVYEEYVPSRPHGKVNAGLLILFIIIAVLIAGAVTGTAIYKSKSSAPKPAETITTEAPETITKKETKEKTTAEQAEEDPDNAADKPQTSSAAGQTSASTTARRTTTTRRSSTAIPTTRPTQPPTQHTTQPPEPTQPPTEPTQPPTEPTTEFTGIAG